MLDSDLGLCLGCGRTRDEIARWSRLAESERVRIITTLYGRLSRVNAAIRKEKR